MEPVKKYTVWKRTFRLICSELGIAEDDLKSMSSLARLLHSPRDPSGLAFIRILFGILMVVDVHHERGLARADDRWGDPSECRFPLIYNLRPLALEWMILLYFVMLLGAVGIALGYRFRLSCLCFLIPYWYMFLLDKSRWNNHSYLFGLIAVQLAFSDANRCWSLDGKRISSLRNTHVPLWNYALIRGQIFLVYFVAGLKKTDLDWIGGYSMEKLGHHWVFAGFRLFLSGDHVTQLIVHLGGFLLDLTVGFFLLSKTLRPLGFLLCTLFNGMNSRMFAIGMFPYVMIAVMPIFCNDDWPKKCFQKMPTLNKITSYDFPTGRNESCIYLDANNTGSPSKNKPKNVSVRHRLVTVVFCSYFLIQGFLPYSHWLTKGYNTWTYGPYGYSWDMMVHHWRHLHTSLAVIDKKTGSRIYLDPDYWSPNRRWSHHADMVKQMASCIQQKLAKDYGLEDISFHVDVWVSLNGRFTQRMYNPTVDILSAEWSPFKEVSWILPLQSNLTDWRKRLAETEEQMSSGSDSAGVVFVVDFPGFNLINYVDSAFRNVTLSVLKGTVEVKIPPNQTFEIGEGQQAEVPSEEYHLVSPRDSQPACYMYSYYTMTNNTALAINSHKDFLRGPECSCEGGNDEPCKFLCLESWKADLMKKFGIWSRSISLIGQAVYSIVTNTPMQAVKSKEVKSF